MILTVTLNLSVDVTYHVDRVELGVTRDVRSVARRAGGKGVNVARVLHALGREVVVTGFAGGQSGAAARAELAASGLDDATVDIAGDSRTTLVVVDEDGEATGFSEPGPEVSPEEWRTMVAHFSQLVDGKDAVVMSGSVPPGVSDDAYAQLIALAAGAGVPVLLDTRDAPLTRALSASPAIVKVNRDELLGAAELMGLGDQQDALGAVARIRDSGARALVISSGPAGLLGVCDGGAWRAVPPERLRGNPTGAGDAAAAALVVGLVDGVPWPERLVEAAALSAAAVCAPLAGSFDDAVYRRLRREIAAEEVELI
jgi:tagatose 6-phosphate kinase